MGSCLRSICVPSDVCQQCNANEVNPSPRCLKPAKARGIYQHHAVDVREKRKKNKTKLRTFAQFPKTYSV